jgi:hypothetical protein
MQVVLDQHRMIEELRAEIEQLKRRGGAAPFSKGTRKPNPKPPGRKPGQGYFRFRGEPEGLRATEPVLVAVAGCCPDCGGALGEAVEEIVSITDVPVEPRIEMRRYAVETRQCGQCGKSVRGRHPDIAEGQRGATAHRVGPRIKALAHVLHFAHGLPVRKTPSILEELTGVRLTQGAITQDAMKQADGIVGARYEQLRASVREQAVMHTDDTGWRVGGRTTFLMAFVSPIAIALCRAMHIPARYATGYLGDIGVPVVLPMDFSAWFEVYLGDRWWTFDARNNRPRIGRVLMATGRDAADVALTTTFGTSWLNRFSVVSAEVAEAVLPQKYLTRDGQLQTTSAGQSL